MKKTFVGAAAILGALGAGALGFGAGTAQADDDWTPWMPWMPWMPWAPWVIDDGWHPGPDVPPGQLKKWCPWQTPPGHWIDGPHGIPCT